MPSRSSTASASQSAAHRWRGPVPGGQRRPSGRGSTTRAPRPRRTAPASGSTRAGQDAEQRRLAAAVDADDGQPVAARHRDRQVGEQRLARAAHGQALRRRRGSRRRRYRRRRSVHRRRPDAGRDPHDDRRVRRQRPLGRRLCPATASSPAHSTSTAPGAGDRPTPTVEGTPGPGGAAPGHAASRARSSGSSTAAWPSTTATRAPAACVRLDPGGFLVDGRARHARPALGRARPAAPAGRTASGSTAVRDRQARVARASRILVEGIHDAELVEKVWGDDLRVEGVVVERLDGMDHLADVVADVPARARPAAGRPARPPGRRLEGGPGGRRGPPPRTCSSPARPTSTCGRPCAPGRRHRRLAGRAPGRAVEGGRHRRPRRRATPGEFWRMLLGQVSTFADLDPALVGAVEQLIDFVTSPEG